jgi:hypothetical protein
VVSSLIPPQGGLGVLAEIQQEPQFAVTKKPDRIVSADQHQKKSGSASAQRFMGVQGSQIPVQAQEERQRPPQSAFQRSGA